MTLDEQLSLMELILKDNDGGFRTVDQVNEKEVNWELIEDQFQGRNIHADALRKNWRRTIKPALGVSKYDMSTIEGLHMFERKLLRTVLNSGAKHIKEVIWQNVQDSFPTKDVYYLSNKFHTMIRYINRTKQKDFRKAVALVLKNGRIIKSKLETEVNKNNDFNA